MEGAKDRQSLREYIFRVGQRLDCGYGYSDTARLGRRSDDAPAADPREGRQRQLLPPRPGRRDQLGPDPRRIAQRYGERGDQLYSM